MITIFILAECPHCQRARQWILELQEENAAYKAISIEYIDEKEQPEVAQQYDYYYVPTFYVENEKVHEGKITKEEIASIFAQVIQ